jgi:hypothetical protein
MPFKEALFWCGITVFGTGLFFLVEGDGSRMVIAIGLTLLGLIVLGYSVYSHHKPGSYKMPVWIAVLVLTWAAVGYDYYDRHQLEIGPLLNTATQASLNEQQTKILNHLKRMGSNWGEYRYEYVTDRTFEHDTILLDGKKFVNCRFIDVTFVYEGTAPFEMSEVSLSAKWQFRTDVPQLAPLLRLFSAAGLLPPSGSIPPKS